MNLSATAARPGAPDKTDPKRFEALQAELTETSGRVDRLADKVDKLADAVIAINTTLHDAKGGWKVLMAASGLVATLMTLVVKLAMVLAGGGR